MNDLFTLAIIEWRYLLGYSSLEIIGTLCAIAGVFLVARQNILGWPLGIVWAGISTYLAFFEWHLLSDGILYATYIPIQIYCWIVWARHGAVTEKKTEFKPSWMSTKAQLILVIAAVAAIAVWALGISRLSTTVAWIPEPALLWRDSSTTVLNFFAQFLQAKKRMENWIGWLIVNLLGIHIYWVKEAPIYSIQYAFFLFLGLYGWWKWNQSLKHATI